MVGHGQKMQINLILLDKLTDEYYMQECIYSVDFVDYEVSIINDK